VLLGAPAAGDVLADGRDQWTLLDRHLVNRQLFEQIRADDQWFRLGRNLDPLAVAADARIGTQQTLDSGMQSRFHGFYVLNTFGAVRPLDGIDANLNLTLLNPSASDGYRSSSQLHAGFALHGYYDLDFGASGPLKLDVFGTDLGLVTLGRGLLLEQWQSEGEAATARFQSFELRQTFIGRALWQNDDVIALALRGFDNRAEISVVRWQFDETPMSLVAGQPAPPPGPIVRSAANFFGASVDMPFTKTLRAAAEYSGRFRDGALRSAALGRIDFLDRDLAGISLHLGYSFRYYEAGFGPRERFDPPTTSYNVPDLEDVYVTNSFEYFGISEYFHQWSHTAMVEAIVPIFPILKVVADGEYFVRFASDRNTLPRVVYLEDWGLFPGSAGRLFYKAGLRLEPFRGLPHRLDVMVTNKQVVSGLTVTDLETKRFQDGNFYVIQLGAYL
jgi:hypothetical protein